MKKIEKIMSVVLVSLLGSGLASAQSLTVEQVLQRSVDHQYSLNIARLQQQRAALESDRVLSTLGWNVGGSGSYSHDVGFTGIPADKYSVAANAGRLLVSGDTVSASGVVSYEDAEASFGTLPNPNLTSQWTASYRKPLWQGRANPAYVQGLKSAAASEQIAEQQIAVTRDQIASQVIDLYFNLVFMNQQIANLQSAQKRTRRLLDYIRGNEKLGLAEARDLLQVRAQLDALRAETRALQINRRNLIIGLNRLMGRELSKPVEPVFTADAIKAEQMDVVIEIARQYDPRIRIRQAQIELAQAAIERGRDQRRNKLDTVFSLGLRTSAGDSQQGPSTVEINEQDWAGSIGLEYQHSLDTRGKDAVVRQAQLDKDIALEEIKSIQEVIAYDVQALVAEAEVTDAALMAYRKRLASERAKLKEGEQRYRKGRADTQQLILFENDLKTAELMVSQQQIEQTRKKIKLSLITGQIWEQVVPLKQQAGGK